MYVYCVVCYRVIIAPYVRSVGHVFAYLYTLDDDLERPMDYETSLLPKVFPLLMLFCSKTSIVCYFLLCTSLVYYIIQNVFVNKKIERGFLFNKNKAGCVLIYRFSSTFRNEDALPGPRA